VTGPAYHGWTHRPASEGGTDPIPVAAGDLKWATAVQFDTSTAKSTSWYYADFTDMGTNDTDAFTLETASFGTALGINTGGIYQLIFGVTAGSSAWGTNYAAIQPIFDEGGSATPLDSEGDFISDYMLTLFNRSSEVFAAEQPASPPRHRNLFAVMTINYDPPSPPVGNYGFEVPLMLGVRVLTDQTGSVSFQAQISAIRIAAGGYTAVSA
jgi:hypothetical protein